MHTQNLSPSLSLLLFTLCSMLTESLLTAFEQPRSPTPSDSSSRTQSPQPGIGPPMPNISLDILSGMQFRIVFYPVIKGLNHLSIQ